MLSEAIAITAKAFVGVKDKGGSPYILHCLTVMNGVKDLNEDVQCAAIMHDLIEDTDWTIGDLRDVGFSERVLELLSLLTHVDVSYDTYIKQISTDKDAIRIKMADLRHNSDIFRLKGLRDKDIVRMMKYQRSFLTLKEALNGK